MASNKLQRTNDDIQFVLSNLLRQVKDPRVNQGSLISITRVDTTGDLRYCKVYVSSLEGMESTRQSVKGLTSAQGYIRRELGMRLHTRKTPELRFIADDSIEISAKISKRLEEIIPEETEANEQPSDAQ